jgi:O-antigen ligase
MNSASISQRIPIYLASAVSIVVIPNLMDPINLPKMVLLALGAGITLGVCWKDFSNLWEQSSRPLFLISCWFALALLLVIIYSPQPLFKSIVGVWGRNNGSLTYISLLVLFLAIASQKSLTPAIHVIKALTILGFGCAAYGVLQSLELDPIRWENPGNKVVLTLGNSNFAGSFTALTAVASLGYLVMFMKSIPGRALLLISYFAQIYVILKSEALQGVIICFLGSGLFLGFLLSFSKAKFVKGLGVAWWLSFAAISFVGLISVFGIGPLASTISPYLVSLIDRYYHWVAAINMMKDHLFFGVGIDSFGDYYRLNRVQAAIDLRGTAATGTNNAHNIFFQIGATGGLLLLSAYLTLTLYIAYCAVRALKIQEDKVLTGALISIWIAFQAQSFVSIDQIGLVVWGWILGGCIVSISFYTPPSAGGQKKSKANQLGQESARVRLTTINFIVMIFGLIPSILLTPVLANELVLRKRIVEFASSTTEEEASFRAQTVVDIARESKQPELRLQAVNYLLALKRNDAALSLTLLNNKEFPMSFESWKATAFVYEFLGDKKRAKYPLQRSVELDPLNVEIKKLPEQDQTGN